MRLKLLGLAGVAGRTGRVLHTVVHSTGGARSPTQLRRARCPSPALTPAGGNGGRPSSEAPGTPLEGGWPDGPRGAAPAPGPLAGPGLHRLGGPTVGRLGSPGPGPARAAPVPTERPVLGGTTLVSAVKANVSWCVDQLLQWHWQLQTCSGTLEAVFHGIWPPIGQAVWALLDRSFRGLLLDRHRLDLVKR